VIFEQEEIDNIKMFDKPGLKLMGFKPAMELRSHHNYRSSYFIYPNNNKVKNSAQVCHALISTMLKKKNIAIVRFIPKRTS